jgi:predicted nucleotidyltransferase
MLRFLRMPPLPRNRAAAIPTSIRYACVVPQVAAQADHPPSILPQLVARIVEVLHPVQVWLFGSRARGEARPDSDWDIMAILPDEAPEEDLDLGSVWGRLRDLRLQRVEIFTMTRSEFEEWNRSLGTLAEIVASTGVVVYGG